MAIASLVIILVVYTTFFGRNQVALNESIYENYRFTGQPGSTQLATSEGYGLTTYGADGLIVNKPLNPDSFRVLFIGDSFVKAKQVSDAEKFTELVEQQWNSQHADKHIQSLNLGLGGQDMATYISFGKNMDHQFQPALVFLMVSADDFRKVLRNPQTLGKIVQHIDQPLVKPERSSKIQDVANQLGIRSFLGQIQSQTFAFIEPKDQISVAEANEGASLNSQTTRAEAISIQIEALQAIWGDRLVIIFRERVPNMGRGQSTRVINPILNQIKAHDIPIIILYPRFQEAFSNHHPPFGFSNSVLGKGHLNIYGHQLVADEIIHYLETQNDLF